MLPPSGCDYRYSIMPLDHCKMLVLCPGDEDLKMDGRDYKEGIPSRKTNAPGHDRTLTLAQRHQPNHKMDPRVVKSGNFDLI